MTEYQVGFLCQSPDADEADPDEPLWEIVIGEIRNDWTPNDPLQMPTRICCGQCDDDQWAPMVSVSRKIDLHMASYIADEFNKKFLGEGIRHWAVIFFDGDSPLTELRLSEDFR